MGLLRRKQHAPVIGTRNSSTRRPSASNHTEPESSLSNASMMAAQAAASLAHTHHEQQAQQALPRSTTTPSPASAPSTQRPLAPRRMSRNIVHSNSSRSLASNAPKRNSYVSISSSPVNTRTTASNAQPSISNGFEHSMENLNLQDSTDEEKRLTSSNLASLAAQSAAAHSTDFLAPPTTSYRGNYNSGSSPSSIASSIHSFDSPPFHAKVSGLGSMSKGDEFFANLNRSESGLSDFDPQQEADDYEWLNRSKSSITSSVCRQGRQVPECLKPQSKGNLSSQVIDEDSEDVLEPAAIISEARERERQASTTSTDELIDNEMTYTDQHEQPTSASAPRAVRKPIPTRKPPPKSPQIEAQGDVNLAVPPNVPPRALSPRRKPPPDALYDSTTDDPTQNESVMDSEEEILPQYPLGPDEIKKHHRSIRKGAKKIWKKGLKGASYAPTNFLNDSEVSLASTTNAGGQKPVHLKTTMRDDKKKKKKAVFNEDKPWKHHTDVAFVSESERKRYEGIWVTNKGLYMDRVDPDGLIHDTEVPGQLTTALKASMMSMKSDMGAMESNLMVNVVVREVWERSRLPHETLQKVWDLVDTRHDGTLDRTSFIVGMWLVDQCLYGRKLPREVSDAVWNSVAHNGLNVVLKGLKKK